ncbi:MAG TPA: putative 2OG-Fe(II) oxygenase [Kofleriaceae bacterium]|nr:putative 2OG-Fe(II) oxygenase [Kofleriaceae bacterium]
MDGVALFATPVFSFPEAGDPELDRELTERLVAESESSPGIVRSNSGGWHSVPDVSQRQEPCYQELMRRVVGGVQQTFFELVRGQAATAGQRYRFGVQAWAMVMRHGDHTLVHDHADAHFSVVYYADAGDADLTRYPDSGKLTLMDPRRGGTVISGVELAPSLYVIEPRAGLLVVFPGWLQHFVQPYRGTRPRVTISCNVRLDADPRADPRE